MTYRTPEEVQRYCVELMEEPLGNVYFRLYNECAVLHFRWAQYVELFGRNEARIALVNRVAPMFFRLLQDALWDDALMHIARLTDERISGQRETLSIQQLPGLVGEGATRHELQRRVTDCLAASKVARDWRNRRLAHIDYNLAIRTATAKPLEPASREQVTTALQAIARVLNVVEHRYLEGSPVQYDRLDGHGALSLLYRLRDGLDADEQRKERIKAGEASPRGHPPTSTLTTRRQMIAAIYARKSTDQTGVADEQKSVARQIDHARAYAARKGWTVLDEHVYVDDGISGAEFANRPGFLRLMNALKPRPPFQVLVMSRGVAARPRGDRDGLRAEAARAGRRARVLLPRGPRADARLPDRQDHAVADGVRRRARAREGAAADVRRDAAEGAAPATSPAAACSATTTSRSSAPTASGRTSSGGSTTPRPPSCGASSSCARPAPG